MVIGFDIGGSNIRGVLWSSSARWNGKKILRSFTLPTPKNLKNFKKLVFEMTNNFVGGGVKVGIGIAGVIKNNKIVSTTNIKYLKNYSFPKTWKVDNDARCFARAEYKIVAGQDAKSMLMITLGTGVGRAFVKNGKILNIKKFEKAEKWEKEYQKIKDKNKLAKFLSEKLASIIYTLDPEIIVLGGGVIEEKGYYDAIKKQLSLTVSGTKLKIKHSRLGKFAGAIGGALLFD